MAQTIKLKRSATQNAVPSTSSLALGELAINTYDGKLFIKKNVSGTESIVTIGEVGANSIGPTELASTAVTAGSYGSTSAIPVITIDADGRITSASTATISGLSANSVTSTEIAANAVGISELNVSDGTDGQVLTTDGSGNLAFEDQSGGAASATAFSTNIASGDGSTTAFTLSESPSAESKIIAFINGVFQNQDAYTISGTTLTFDTAPISGTNNVVVYVIGDVYSGESVLISNFSGNGTTTAFTLANNPGNENNTQVYIDGVYQQKTTYSVSGTTLTFSSAPPTGTNNIEVVMLTSTTVNTPAAGSVVTASMADDSVTGAKIVSSAVTTAKIADSNVTTAKIADDAVTIGKIADAALVIESEGISSNDNDTTLPTSAAVKDYVDTQVAGKDALSELSGDTDDVTEGSTNLYFTNARADARITNALKDEDNMASNSATHIPSQQSVKAYVDSQVASKDALSELSGDTDDVTEGSTNLYYTDARVGTYISGNRTYGNITTTGYLAGPSTFTIDPAAVGDNTGTLVIAGNLQVDGTTTTVNSTTLTVDDKLITLGSGSANAGAANGAGIEVDITGSTNPSLTYDGTNDEWDFNKDINVTGTITSSGNITGTLATAAQPNITSVGTLTGLTSSGTIGINNSSGYGNIELGGSSGGFIDFKTPFVDDKDARIFYGGTQLVISTNADQPILIKHNNVTVLETSSSGIEITGRTLVSDDQTNDWIKQEVSGTTSTISLGNTESTGATAQWSYNRSSGLLSGNIGTAASTNFMTVKGTGNIGFGTDSPDGKVHILKNSAGTVSATSDANTLVVEDDNVGMTFLSSTTSVARIRFGDADSNARGQVFYNHNSDSFGFQTAGLTKLTLTQDGELGIGTNNPSDLLDVRGDGADTYIRVGSDTGAGSKTARIGKIDSSTDFIIQASAGTTSSNTIFKRNSSTETVRIDSSGNVGIGTASPAEKLDVQGDIKVGGGLKIAANTTSGNIGFNRDPDSGAAYTAGLQRMQINGPFSGSDFLDFQSYNSSGTYTGSFYLNAGKVGIGTSNPAQQLHIYKSSGNVLAQIQSGSSGVAGLTLQTSAGASTIYAGVGSVQGLMFYANGTSEAMRINSSGNVGIGTTSPTEKLTVNGAILASGALQDDRTSTAAIDFTSNVTRFVSYGASGVGGQFAFRTASGGASSAERVRINYDGNVGIGTTSPLNELQVNGDVHIGNGADYSSYAKLAVYDSVYQGDVGLLIKNDRYNDSSATTSLIFEHRTHGQQGHAAKIVCRRQGAYNESAGSKDAALDFYTAEGSTLSHRMQIDREGRVGIGTGTTGLSYPFIVQSGTTDQQLRLASASSSISTMHAGFGCNPSADITIQAQGSGVTWRFGSNVSNGNAYWINQNNVGVNFASGSNAWSAHSDERLKENITDIGSVLDVIQDYRCVKFNFKSSPDKEIIGFIAQDWETDFPEVVDEDDAFTIQDDGSLVEANKEGNVSTTKVKSIAYTETIPVLLKAIQEQQTLIDDLKSRLDEAGL